MGAIDEICRGLVIANPIISNHSARAIVNIQSQPLYKEDVYDCNPNLRLTNGVYYIRYQSKGSKFRNPKRPFLILNDLVQFRVAVSGPKHFYAMSTQVPEMDWLIRNTNYTTALFIVAKQHPGLNVPFCMDVMKILNRANRQAKESGKELYNGTLFGSRECTVKDAKLYENVRVLIAGKDAYMDERIELEQRYNKEEKL